MPVENAFHLSFFAKSPLDRLPAAVQGGAVRDWLRATIEAAPPLEGLADGPADRAALFQQGGALLQAGQAQNAMNCYAAALRAEPGLAPGWTMLGLCLGATGAPDAELACYEEAVRLQPEFGEAQYCLASACKRNGQLNRALHAAGHACAAQPDNSKAWFLLGGIRAALGQHGPAAEAFAHAAETVPTHTPDHAKALLEQGNAQHAQKRLRASLATYRAALAARPGYPEALSNLGCVLQELGQLDEALAHCQDAIRLKPDFAGAHRNLGTALHTLGQFDEAADCYRHVLALDPRDADALCYLGAAHADTNRAEQAESYYQAALALAPDNVDIRFDRSLALLKSGRLAEGFAEHEWRWRGLLPPHNLSQPQWQGEPLNGRSVLLHAEQGMGDSLQFARYAPLAGLAGKVVLEVQAPLVRLMQSLPHVDRVIATGSERPQTDLHCSLMSLPHVFGTTMDSIPAPVPYLAPDEALTALWKRIVDGALQGSAPGLKIGLVWAGNPRLSEVRTYFTDRRRSMALEALAPLGRVNRDRGLGIHWFNLQIGDATSQAALPPPGLQMTDLTGFIGDFADTAALMQQLDLVISVDTSAAHLAGALGIPVWLLSRSDSCWRWLQHTDRSPWYPSMRVWRQPAPGQWSPVVDDMAAALAALAQEHAPARAA